MIKFTLIFDYIRYYFLIDYYTCETECDMAIKNRGN